MTSSGSSLLLLLHTEDLEDVVLELTEKPTHQSLPRDSDSILHKSSSYSAVELAVPSRSLDLVERTMMAAKVQRKVDENPLQSLLAQVLYTKVSFRYQGSTLQVDYH